MKPFSIKKISSETGRPPYSHKVEEYFETFVTENILKPFNLVLNDEWKTVISIMIFSKVENSEEVVSFYEPDVIGEQKIRSYPVVIYLDDIYAGDNPVENIISLYFQVVSLFFLSNYSTVTTEYMMGLKDKIDWDYLLAIPFPAAPEEQHYVGDQ